MSDVTQIDLDRALKHLGFDSVADLHYWAMDDGELNRFDALADQLAEHRIAAEELGRLIGFQQGLDASKEMVVSEEVYRAEKAVLDKAWSIARGDGTISVARLERALERKR